MVIIINPYAGGGRALKKWQKIERLISDKLNSFENFFLRHDTDLDVIIKNYLNKGHLHFVSAGGDCSLNMLTRSLIENVPENLFQEINIGAIGLGSINDFHKPFRDSSMINNIPCKVNFSSTTKRDVGMLEYLNENGKRSKHFWLINASIGITI